MSETNEVEVWVVDRVEDGIAVLVEDDGDIIVQVAAALLGDLAVEGAILRVPLGSVGEPVWTEATRDIEAEQDRLQQGERRLDELKRRDPGGDIVL